MNDIVRAGAEESALLRLPTFDRFEQIAEALARVREEAAQAREPTKELVEHLDTAIALTSGGASEIAAASAKASKVEVANFLALLGKSYLNSKAQDVRIFAQVMLADVMAMQPTLGAIEIACRRWRQRTRFMPEIAELLGELRAAKGQVENTVEFIGRLPALRECMAREIGQS
jgi:hypothetical protein